MATAPTTFWDDLNEDLKDPEHRHHYILESERIASIDRIVNQLDEIRDDLGITKAELARAIERTPATVRRLLTSRSVNPQFSVISEMAAVLGYRVTLSRMSSREIKEVSEPLRERIDA